MQPEQATESPQVKLKEHWVDLDWIIHNLLIFAPAAEAGHRSFGRGALIIDISNINEDKAFPFAYFSQEEIDLYEDKDINQMIAAYEPLEELVIILIKAKQLPRSYRVRTVPDGY